MDNSIPVSVTAFIEAAMSSYLWKKAVRWMQKGKKEETHLSACSANLALCTNSSFSVMVPERWRLREVPRLLSVTGPHGERGREGVKEGKEVKTDQGAAFGDMWGN